jgi:DNA-binding response OmpR family regulator
MSDLNGTNGTLQGERRSGRLRVFFIEDNTMTSQAFLLILRLAGYEVRHAGNYQQALAMADGEFDLVLSDIALPDGSGWEVMRHIRSRWAHIPGIALSGFGSEEDVSTSRAAGFAVHLTKPVSFQTLEATIKMVTGQ